MSEPIIRLEKTVACRVCGASEKLHESWRSGHTFDPIEKTFRVSYFEGHREEVTPMKLLQSELADYISGPEFSASAAHTQYRTAYLGSAVLVTDWLADRGYLSEKIAKGGS